MVIINLKKKNLYQTETQNHSFFHSSSFTLSIYIQINLIKIYYKTLFLKNNLKI